MESPIGTETIKDKAPAVPGIKFIIFHQPDCSSFIIQHPPDPVGKKTICMSGSVINRTFSGFKKHRLKRTCSDTYTPESFSVIFIKTVINSGKQEFAFGSFVNTGYPAISKSFFLFKV